MPAVAMQRLSCTVRFDTPAFLGDAEQNGAWRTPPFKALLREWWRVYEAKACRYDVAELRRREYGLFGGVFGEKEENARGSRVRLRLMEWRKGVQANLPAVEKIGKPPANPLIYLGYGPVNSEKNPDGKGRRDVVRRHLQVNDEPNTLQIIASTADMCALREVLQFINWFGTLGSRARNGWGSLRIERLQSTPGEEAQQTLLSADEIDQGTVLLREHALPYREALRREWPHAFGCSDDGRLLIWKTAKRGSWADVMRDLALAKQAFRKAVPAARRGYGRRHLLAYPVTKQIVEEWKADRSKNLEEARFANQLRYKVHRLANGYAGYAFHLPCGLAQSLRKRLQAADQRIVAEYEADDWGLVHAALDRVMQRIA